MRLGDEAVSTKLLIVVFGVIIFVDFCFFFEEGIEASSSSLAWPALEEYLH